MAYSACQPCPKCKEVHEIFVLRDSIPALEDRFVYTCPKCKSRILATFGAYVCGVTVPPGAIVAEPA